MRRVSIIKETDFRSMEQPITIHKSSATYTANTSKTKTLLESQMELNIDSINNTHANEIQRESQDKMTRKGNVEPMVASNWSTEKRAPSTHHHPPFPHHGQRPSLAGFDPFSHEVISSPINTSFNDNDARKTLQPIKVLSPSNNVVVDTTILSPREKRSQENKIRSPTSNGNDRRQLPSPMLRLPVLSPESENAASGRRDGKNEDKATSLSPHHHRKANSQTVSSGGGKLLSFVRKGHRRTKSLEGSLASMKIGFAMKQRPLPNGTDSHVVNESLNTVVDTTTDKERSDIVQDLMELKDNFVQLQIPSLAKPSPTSFLTGKGDEAVRTSYYEPSPFQMEIPSLHEFKEVARMNEFVENYRRMDQNFDLQQFVGASSVDLNTATKNGHVSIAQSLIECGEGITLQGFLSVGDTANERLEAVVFEGQRYFVVVFRGTTEQQAKILGNSKTKRKGVPLDPEQENVEVYSGFQTEYSKLEQQFFSLIDKLTETHPFCDVVFSGFSFGAALATLAATRYAMARPMMRVGCFTMASPKVGFSLLRHVVNSLPNLKVMRIELGQDARCQGPTVGGWHVGHTLVLNGSFGHHVPTHKIQKTVIAYKFDTPKHKKFKTTHPDLRNYVSTLEEMARLQIPWVKDFANTSGQGVVVNNESRQVV